MVLIFSLVRRPLQGIGVVHQPTRFIWLEGLLKLVLLEPVDVSSWFDRVTKVFLDGAPDLTHMVVTLHVEADLLETSHFIEVARSMCHVRDSL